MFRTYSESSATVNLCQRNAGSHVEEVFCQIRTLSQSDILSRSLSGTQFAVKGTKRTVLTVSPNSGQGPGHELPHYFRAGTTNYTYAVRIF